MIRALFRRPKGERGYRVEYEHPTQLAASAFLRAVAADDADAVWGRLSQETRGLLEGLRAARSGVALHEVAESEDAERVRALVAPLRSATLAALGGGERIGRFGVSAARSVDRRTAYVLLLSDFGEERIVQQADWAPAHLLAFVHEAREWVVDLGRTAALSAEAGLPDPLGTIL